MAKDELIPAIVAKGRSVHLDGGVDTVGKGINERKIVREGRIALPGERIMLPESEVADLRKHGFLEKPDGTLSETALIGPKTMQEGAAAPDVPET